MGMQKNKKAPKGHLGQLRVEERLPSQRKKARRGGQSNGRTVPGVGQGGCGVQNGVDLTRGGSTFSSFLNKKGMAWLLATRLKQSPGLLAKDQKNKEEREENDRNGSEKKAREI